MPFTQTQYNALMDAIGQGALIVKYADKEVEYRNLDDMLRLKSLMENDLGIATEIRRTIKSTFRSGLNRRAPGSDWGW
jgi:hypothetical protein